MESESQVRVQDLPTLALRPGMNPFLYFLLLALSFNNQVHEISEPELVVVVVYRALASLYLICVCLLH